MTKEKQIEEIANILWHIPGNYFLNSYNDCERTAECIYDDGGYRKQEWISVDERLPEDGVWVLGYSAKSGRGGLCNCLKSYVREFGNYDDTTHWLPLPEFPKNKGE